MENESTENISEIPKEFICGISQQIMNNPVITSSGQSYDEENIKKWLNYCLENHKPFTDPLTRKIISRKFTVNYALKSLIHRWKTNYIRSLGPKNIDFDCMYYNIEDIGKILLKCKCSPTLNGWIGADSNGVVNFVLSKNDALQLNIVKVNTSTTKTFYRIFCVDSNQNTNKFTTSYSKFHTFKGTLNCEGNCLKFSDSKSGWWSSLFQIEKYSSLSESQKKYANLDTSFKISCRLNEKFVTLINELFSRYLFEHLYHFREIGSWRDHDTISYEPWFIWELVMV